MAETFSKLWNYSEKQHGTLIKALIFSFLRCSFGITQILAVIAAANVIAGKTPAASGIKQIAVLTVICIAGNYFTSYIEQISSLRAGMNMTADGRDSAGKSMRLMPLGLFSEAFAGKIISTLTTTLSGVEMAAPMTMIGIISGLFSSVIMFIFMMFYSWKIGLVTGIGMVIYLAVVNMQIKISRRNAPALQKAQSELSHSALTFLHGIKVTKAFSFRNGDAGLKKSIESSRDENLRLTDRSMPSQFAAHLTIAVFESLIFISAIHMYFVSDEITAVTALVLIIFSFMAYAALNQAGSMLSMIGLLESGLSEVYEIENTDKMETIQPVEKCTSGKDADRIVFENVCFSFGENEVLHNISTVIEPDSLTAVIGPSGSGKTTLCQLIPRFRDVSSGRITIGGADVRHIEYEELMKKISMVFQNVYLFEDTVLNNIRFGKPDASQEEVEKAARAAGCHDFIMALPDGYNTVISEGGGSLSGGEKQRISIARAMLKDSPIIILDEATSALDAENEHEILAAIDELTKNKTVIMIAHRIKTVKNAQHIIVLDDGRIVQEGNHQQLIQQAGIYTDFINARTESAGWKLSN